MTDDKEDQCSKCFRFHVPGVACPYPTKWNVPERLIDKVVKRGLARPGAKWTPETGWTDERL